MALSASGDGPVGLHWWLWTETPQNELSAGQFVRLTPGPGGRGSIEELSPCGLDSSPSIFSGFLGWDSGIRSLQCIIPSRKSHSIQEEGSLFSEFPGELALSGSLSLLCGIWLGLCLWQGSRRRQGQVHTHPEGKGASWACRHCTEPGFPRAVLIGRKNYG